MARKDVDEYYEVISTQYADMLAALRDMEEESQKGLLDPDRLEQMKKIIEPLKTNYMRISYIMYLLNKPNRKSKRIIYEAQNKKLLNKIGKENTLASIEQENDEVIGQIQM